MEKYGFFGGSFNPVTKAHVELAEEIRNKYGLDKVIFVPVGDKYNKIGLISEKHRNNMLKIAICKYDNLEVSNIELNKEKNLKVASPPSYNLWHNMDTGFKNKNFLTTVITDVSTAGHVTKLL